jgi:glycosyltransferase involved in cell wall biosynthesis
MKILIINTSERKGGAAVAAGRLMLALQKNSDLEVKMLVRDKQTDNPDVFSVNNSFIKKKINYLRFVWERLVIFLNNRFNRNDVFAVSIANTGTDISKHPLVKDADIIHLHWINHGFLSLADIKKLIRSGKPVVWTMHDMWPCTGICHHARDCGYYQNQCQSCFFLHSAKKCDLSSRIFSKKKKMIADADITFVGCSHWLSNQAKKSGISSGKQIKTIPNPIDTSIFYPIRDIAASRKELGLPLTKKLLLFGSVNISDKRKGFDYLVKAVDLIKENNDIEIITFGQIKKEIKSLFHIPIHFMGYLTEESRINLLYNSVDMFVTPSLEENLPNTIMEAMACGVPCVGFHIGGIPEMIDHKINGYIAKYKDADDLAVGIEWVLENKGSVGLSEACLKKVQENYTEPVVAEKYMNIYKILMETPETK